MQSILAVALILGACTAHRRYGSLPSYQQQRQQKFNMWRSWVNSQFMQRPTNSQFNGRSSSSNQPSCPGLDTSGFQQAWSFLSQVPNNISAPPPMPATVTYRNKDSTTILTKPGAIITTDAAQNFPEVGYPCDNNKLYTLMVYDTEPGFFHGLVENVPNCGQAADGDTVIKHLPSFAFGRLPTDDGGVTLDTNPEPRYHLILVYEQPGRIRMDEREDSTCRKGVAFARVVNENGKISPDQLAQKYGLKLVAGNFIRNVYSGTSTNKWLCFISVCEEDSGFLGFTKIIKGVNDIPGCKAVHGL